MSHPFPSAKQRAPDDGPNCGPHRSAKIGDLVTFGFYPQMAGGADRTPIQWRVLQNSRRELFLLSEFLLDCKRYHAEYVDTTWRDCELRHWLNDEFYNAAFDAVEQGFIKTTLCTDNGEGRPGTRDKIFLLSVAEVKALTDRLDNSSSAGRRAVGTEFAKEKKADGCRLYVYDKSVDADYIIENGRGHGCSWWWLRTQLGAPSRATFVGTRASIRSYGRVSLRYYGVRPALKLELP